MHIERTIEIDVAPAILWTLLTETEQVKRWVPELIDDVPLTDPPLRAGSASRMLIREGSREVE